MSAFRWWLGRKVYALGKRLLGVNMTLTVIYIPGRGTVRL